MAGLANKLHPLSFDFLGPRGQVEKEVMAEELPAELEDQCTECHKSLAGIERLLKPLTSMNRAQVEERVGYLISAHHNDMVRYNTCFLDSWEHWMLRLRFF